MADKPTKSKKGDRKRPADSGVMGSLSSTRPARLGERPRGAPAKPRPKAANGAVETVKPRVKPATETTNGTPAKPANGARTRPRPAAQARPEGPRAVRAGAPSLEPETPATTAKRSPPSSGIEPPSGTELVTTAIQATAELAQIGITLSGQLIKRAVERLPRP